MKHMPISSFHSVAEDISTLLLAYSLNQINMDIRFLLARLHMDAFMSRPTLGHIKLALKNLPRGIKGLDKTYISTP